MPIYNFIPASLPAIGASGPPPSCELALVEEDPLEAAGGLQAASEGGRLLAEEEDSGSEFFTDRWAQKVC